MTRVRAKNIRYFMSLPMKVDVVPSEDGHGYVASIPCLKGCIAWGKTAKEACAAVADVKEAWIEIAIEEGWSISRMMA